MIPVESLPSWAQPTEVLDARSHPDTLWAQALVKGDTDAALAIYIDELRNGPDRIDLDFSYIHIAERWYNVNFGHHGGHDYQPDDVVNHKYTGCYGIKHKFKGEIDWLYDPTVDWGSEHTWEWQVQFNRHYQWIPLARVWQKTGDKKYAEAFEHELRSWTSSQCPCPPYLDMSLPGTWRTIEVGIRSGWTWPLAFHVFRKCPDVSDEAIWLLVAAMRQHGKYLMTGPRGGNFKLMESCGMGHVGLMFPELLDAYAFTSTALDRCVAEMDRQFYPDGIQDELAPSYGLLCVCNMFSLFKLAEKYGHLVANERLIGIRGQTWKRLATMGTALSRIAMPDGEVPCLNDSRDLNVTAVWNDMHTIPRNELPERPYHEAQDGADHVDWAGYGVLRREGRYSLMDVGPLSTAHSHHDHLQVVTYGAGRPWCIDPGKPVYSKSDTSVLLRSSAAHNVVLMDGLSHQATPLIKRTDTPFPSAVVRDDLIHVVAAKRSAETQEDTRRRFSHERILLDITDIGWLIIDRLAAEDGEAHTWEWLWHFADTVELDISTGHVVATDNGSKMTLRATSTIDLSVSDVSGRMEPTLRGWSIGDDARTPYAIPTVQLVSDQTESPVLTATLMTLDDVKADDLSVSSSGEECAVRFSANAQACRLILKGQSEIGSIAATLGDKNADIALAPHTL